MGSLLAGSRDDDRSRVPDFTPRNPAAAIDVGTHNGAPLRLVKAHRDAPWGLAHNCDRGRRGIIRCAPTLTAHTVEVDGQSVTVDPSILCPDCGLHGWITRSVWDGHPMSSSPT